ncbi:MAG: CPBP family intramembrane glutamic endopeptidase [Flavobacteriales bacterium]|jgi:membrane protease YdiL (CAAX protease family)
MIPKAVVMRLALGTLIGMPLVAILVDRYFEEVDLASQIIGYQAWYIQTGLGIALGLVAGFSARWLIQRPFMQTVNRKYSNLLGQFNLTWSEVIFISMCAGVGEELLFRGAIQPFMGVVLTAMVFVAIHGYLNPMDWRMSVYGIMMTGFIAAIGFAAEWAGLIPAMIAHTLIDVILLQNLQTGYHESSRHESMNPLSDHHEQEE